MAVKEEADMKETPPGLLQQVVKYTQRWYPWRLRNFERNIDDMLISFSNVKFVPILTFISCLLIWKQFWNLSCYWHWIVYKLKAVFYWKVPPFFLFLNKMNMYQRLTLKVFSHSSLRFLDLKRHHFCHSNSLESCPCPVCNRISILTERSI